MEFDTRLTSLLLPCLLPRISVDAERSFQPPETILMRRALIIGPGGLRGAYSGGVVATLCRAFGHGFFNRIYGCSAGAYTGSYAASGQPDKIESIWRDCVHSDLLVSLSKVITKRRPFLDLFYLNDILRSDSYRLSIERMLSSPTTFEIVATDSETGEPHYFTPDSEESFFLQVRASAAVPVIHPRVPIGGRAYVDGGLSDPIPLERALADGCDEIVIVSNRPVTNIGRLASIFLSVYSSYTSQASDNQVKERLTRVVDLTERLAGRVHIITPSSEHSHRWQFDSEHATLNELVDLGIKDATTFITNCKW